MVLESVDLFLVVRLLAWGKNLRSRVSVEPKVHVVDSGLAARLLRLTPDKLTGFDPAALTDFGHLLETFVVGVIFTTGGRSYTYADRLHVLPIDRLWTPLGGVGQAHLST